MGVKSKPRSSDSPSSAGPPLVLLVATAVLVVVADLVTWAIFVLGCAVGEYGDGRGCGSAFTSLLPPIGAVAVIVGGLASVFLKVRWPLYLGTAAGVVLGLLPWIVFGDPTGNF